MVASSAAYFELSRKLMSDAPAVSSGAMLRIGRSTGSPSRILAPVNTAIAPVVSSQSAVTKSLVGEGPLLSGREQTRRAYVLRHARGTPSAFALAAMGGVRNGGRSTRTSTLAAMSVRVCHHRIRFACILIS